MLCALTAFANAGVGDGDLLNILKRTDVRSDLALDANKITQIDRLLNDLNNKVADLASKISPDIKVGGFNLGKPKDPFGGINKLQDACRVEVMKFLDPAQVARAQEIGVQSEGNFAVLMPAITKQFNLDKKQKSMVESLKKEQLDLRRQLEAKLKKGEITEDAFKSELNAKDAAQQAIIGNALNEDQKKLLVQFAGKKLGS